MRLRQALTRARAGDRPAYVAVGTEVRAARSRGLTMVSLGAALNVDPSLLADCSRLVAAWPAAEARDALASVTLAHCLALVPVRDRATRLRLLGEVKRGSLSVARTRDLARPARLSHPETAEREVQAIITGLAALHARLAVLVDRGTPTSKKAGRLLVRASWALHRLTKRHAGPDRNQDIPILYEIAAQIGRSKKMTCSAWARVQIGRTGDTASRQRGRKADSDTSTSNHCTLPL